MRLSAMMRSMAMFGALAWPAAASRGATADPWATKKDPVIEQKTDAQKAKEKGREEARPDNNVEITVTAARIEIPLKKNPAATSVIETPVLQSMPRTIALDEGMKLVPGVKVENQADGERVHLSIRGEGILTERGTRGIKALVDGIPLNDPSGYIFDFYDVDWATVRRIEVLRGPAAAFFGSGSSGGILNIMTRDGSPDPYVLVHVRLGHQFAFNGTPLELFLSGRNIFNVLYYGFTEPDPDGNSYQPAPTAEWSLGVTPNSIHSIQFEGREKYRIQFCVLSCQRGLRRNRLSGRSRGRPAGSSQPRKRSGSRWRACGARWALPQFQKTTRESETD